eukprot:SAG31_NODE_15076_length_772_cov_0.977712_1_plen_46_part_10
MKASALRLFKWTYNWTLGLALQPYDLRSEDNNSGVFVPINIARLVD